MKNVTTYRDGKSYVHDPMGIDRYDGSSTIKYVFQRQRDDHSHTVEKTVEQRKTIHHNIAGTRPKPCPIMKCIL